MAHLIGPLCKLLCCRCCPGKGNQSDLKLPHSAAELESLGEEWVEQALIAGGMPESTRVTAIKISPLALTGMLSEVFRLAVTLEEGSPLDIVVKIPPPDLKTRITTDLFGLSKSEFEFYNMLTDGLPLRIPRVYFVDYSSTNDSYILMLERVQSKFRGVSTPPDAVVNLTDCKKVMQLLAKWHAHFWGDIQKKDPQGYAWMNRLDDKKYTGLAMSEMKRNWPAFEKFQGEIPDDVADVVDLIVENAPDVLARQLHTGWACLAHGDPRADNFFDAESGELGAIDFQLASMSCVAYDISWFFCTSVPKEMAQAEFSNLVRLYHGELTNQLRLKGMKPPGDVAELEEEIAVAHVMGLCKLGISTGSVDHTKEQAMADQKIMNQRTLEMCLISKSAANFRKAVEGDLISFKRSGTGDSERNESAPLLNR